MTTYTVHFTQTVSLSLTVDADSPDDAIETAHEDGIPGICAQCSGWGRNWSRDDDGELVEEAVSDENGKQVWTAEEAEL